MTLTIVGLVLDVVGVLFVTSAFAFTSSRLIARSAGTYWNYNSQLAREGVRTRTDAQIGLPMIVVGFLLQAVGSVFPEPIPIYRPALGGILLITTIALLIARTLVIERGTKRVLVHCEEE